MRLTALCCGGAALALISMGHVALAASESALGLFERGLSLYKEGDFRGASDAFSGVLETGIDDPVVHYNLGNSYFKESQLGLAIYHYRRAHALAPRDEDVLANLEYARFLVLDRVEEEGARSDQPVEGWIDRVTSAEIFRVAAILWVIAGVAGVLWQLTSPGAALWRRAFVVLCAVWAFVFVAGWTVEYRAGRIDEAVVLPREAKVLNGPGESFETAFVLHEGAEVIVEGERGDWTEISLPGDLRGWISSDWIARL